MKRIDTTQETATSWSPFKVESKAFMQDASKEVIAAVCRRIIVDKTGGYSVSLPYLFENIHGYEVSVFFNNELYLTNYTIGGYAHIDTTPDSIADPTTFSDGTIHNIHNNRYLYFDGNITGALFSATNIVDLTVSTVRPVISTYTTLTNVNTVSNIPLTLLFPTVISDLDGQFLSGVFTPKKLGFYQMSVNVVMGIGTSVTETLGLLFQKNGANTNRCYWTLGNYLGNGNYVEGTLVTVFNVTSITDTYTVKLLTIANETVSVDGNINYTLLK